MTSQKTTRMIEVRVRKTLLFYPLMVIAAWYFMRGRPNDIPPWVWNRAIELYIPGTMSRLRVRWRKSALARYLDRRALYSQRAALSRIWDNAPFPSDLYRWTTRELGRINDQLAATYR